MELLQTSPLLKGIREALLSDPPLDFDPNDRRFDHYRLTTVIHRRYKIPEWSIFHLLLRAFLKGCDWRWAEKVKFGHVSWSDWTSFDIELDLFVYHDQPAPGVTIPTLYAVREASKLGEDDPLRGRYLQPVENWAYYLIEQVLQAKATLMFEAIS